MSSDENGARFVIVVPVLKRSLIKLFVPWSAAVITPHGASLEAFGVGILTVGDVISAIGEPVSRPPIVHEYHITVYSLGGAVARRIAPEEIFAFLLRFRVTPWQSEGAGDACGDDAVLSFLTRAESSYNQARVVVSAAGSSIECVDAALAQQLRSDPIIASLCPVETTVYSIDHDTASVTYRAGFALADVGAAKIVASRCYSAHGIALRSVYDYDNDTSLPEMPLTLRTSTRPRDYQIRAVDAVVGTGMCISGVVVLPCGAGKTLVGIMLLCSVQRPAIILCASSVSVEQWKTQLLDFAALDAEATPITGSRGPTKASRAVVGERIACFTGKQKDRVTANTRLLITTYSMLAVAHRTFVTAQVRTANGGSSLDGLGSSRAATQNRSARAAVHSLFRTEGWGLVLLDEAHVVPAAFFREALSALKAKATVGLTATFVREDDRIADLHHLVGPKLYDVSWEDLRAHGFLADVTCVEMHCPMPREFAAEYWRRCQVSQEPSAATGGAVLAALAAANPSKMVCTLSLVYRHRGSKIIVFCDYIELIKRYAELFKCPVVQGDTPHSERLKIFSDFESTEKVNLILVSRVGDVSVNLPSASVVIQVSSHGGSRRQEAQRLGRILRPKPMLVDGQARMAYFYSLVSDDTIEIRYASHRTAFLVDQGYYSTLASFDADVGMRELHEHDDDTAASYAARATACWALEERVQWLGRVVAHWELSRARRRGRDEASDGVASVGFDSESSSDEDEAASEGLVKHEGAQRAPRQPVDTRTVTLNDVTTLGDGVVYHEFF